MGVLYPGATAVVEVSQSWIAIEFPPSTPHASSVPAQFVTMSKRNAAPGFDVNRMRGWYAVDVFPVNDTLSHCSAPSGTRLPV